MEEKQLRQSGWRWSARWLATESGLRGFHWPDLYSQSLARWASGERGEGGGRAAICSVTAAELRPEGLSGSGEDRRGAPSSSPAIWTGA